MHAQMKYKWQMLIPTLAMVCVTYTYARLYLVDLLENVFHCACMDITTQLEMCLHEQTSIVTNATCRLGSR